MYVSRGAPAVEFEQRFTTVPPTGDPYGGISLQECPNGRIIRGTVRREGSQVVGAPVSSWLFQGALTRSLLLTIFLKCNLTRLRVIRARNHIYICFYAVYAFQLGRFTRENRIPLHMDGARVFNAAVRLGVPVSRIAKHCDSVTFCLSKGLGAPVGSVLTGERSFIEK